MGRAPAPVGESLRRGQPVERAVVLDGRESRPVVLEPPGRWKTFRIERPAPVAVLPAGRADEKRYSWPPSGRLQRSAVGWSSGRSLPRAKRGTRPPQLGP